MRNDFAHKTDLIQIDGILWKIRPAVLDDAAALLDYLTVLAQKTTTHSYYRDGLLPTTVQAVRDDILALRNKPNATVFVAVAGKQIIGAVYCRSGAYHFNHHVINLTIEVHPEYRSMGILTNLMNAAIQWAFIQGNIHRIELEVIAHNKRTINLYHQIGFKFEGILHNAYRLPSKTTDRYEDAVLMALYL